VRVNQLLDNEMTNQEHDPDFGPRLAQFRGSAGYTQAELAQAIGGTRRMVAYYESENHLPPAHVLVELARALEVSTDELLGIKRRKQNGQPHGNSRLMRKLKQLQQLPKAQQNAVIQHIDALAQAQKNTTGKSSR
jgi:transcriptional regulator with XRE-family HTH domain